MAFPFLFLGGCTNMFNPSQKGCGCNKKPEPVRKLTQQRGRDRILPTKPVSPREKFARQLPPLNPVPVDLPRNQHPPAPSVQPLMPKKPPTVAASRKTAAARRPPLNDAYVSPTEPSLSPIQDSPYFNNY